MNYNFFTEETYAKGKRKKAKANNPKNANTSKNANNPKNGPKEDQGEVDAVNEDGLLLGNSPAAMDETNSDKDSGATFVEKRGKDFVSGFAAMEKTNLERDDDSDSTLDEANGIEFDRTATRPLPQTASVTIPNWRKIANTEDQEEKTRLLQQVMEQYPKDQMKSLQKVFTTAGLEECADYIDKNYFKKPKKPVDPKVRKKKTQEKVNAFQQAAALEDEAKRTAAVIETNVETLQNELVAAQQQYRQTEKALNDARTREKTVSPGPAREKLKKVTEKRQRQASEAKDVVDQLEQQLLEEEQVLKEAEKQVEETEKAKRKKQRAAAVAVSKAGGPVVPTAPVLLLPQNQGCGEYIAIINDNIAFTEQKAQTLQVFLQELEGLDQVKPEVIDYLEGFRKIAVQMVNRWKASVAGRIVIPQGERRESPGQREGQQPAVPFNFGDEDALIFDNGAGEGVFNSEPWVPGGSTGQVSTGQSPYDLPDDTGGFYQRS